VPDPDNPGGTKPGQVPNPDFEPDNPTNKVNIVPDPTNPTQTVKEPEPTGKLTDKTRHYTFDIDADVLGRDQSGDFQPGTSNPLEEYNHDKTSEIRKTWIDADGHVIQSENASDVVKGGTKEDGEQGKFGWLEGAEFTLTQIKRHVTTFNGTAGQNGTEMLETDEIPEAERKEIKFDDNHVRAASGSNPKSDAKGYIAMKGLDAGVYVLKEIKAPLGYAFNPNIQYEITITPKYVMEPKTPTEGTTPEDGKGGADDPILESYTVQIKTQKLDDAMNIIGSDEVTTISTYNIKKTDGVPESILDENGTQIVNTTIATDSISNNKSAEVVNKKLGILPATGGSGILFYLFVGGGIAAIALVLMRKTKKAATAA
jgi:LPXTG-motif cell wall-anchored protein